MVTFIPPVPLLLLLLPPPEDVPWLVAVEPPAAGLQPHHTAATQARASDTKAG
jgi:hypothetical protein